MAPLKVSFQSFPGNSVALVIIQRFKAPVEFSRLRGGQWELVIIQAVP